MNKQTYTTLILILIAVLIIIFYPFKNRETNTPNTSTSTPATTTLNTTTKGNKDIIKLTTPKPNQTISSPLTIKGEARGNWYFEANFAAELLDANKKRLTMVGIQADDEWMTTEYVPFDQTFNFPTPTTRTGTLVLHKDNASGLPENDDSLVIPVVFANYGTAKTVNVYFSKNPIGNDCSVVNSVSRNISNTQSVGKAAIEELLKGPTAAEKTQGYSTQLNPETKLNSLTIVNGTAKADFNAKLDFEVAGSCRVGAIQAQITRTLKQFPTVKQVVISINGRTDDILQP